MLPVSVPPGKLPRLDGPLERAELLDAIGEHPFPCHVTIAHDDQRIVANTNADGFQIGRRRNSTAPAVQLLTRKEIVDRGGIVAVYDTTPTGDRAARPRPAWRPDAVERLWQCMIVNDRPELKAFLNTVQDAILKVAATGCLLVVCH